MAAIVVVLRNSSGQFLDGSVRTIVASSASQDEAHAVRMACLFAQSHCLLHMVINSDNRQVIQFSASENVPP